MKVGIYGGTFDPIHNGHLLCAQCIKEEFSLDKIIFIPTGHPAHKAGSRVTPGAMRIEMLKLALENRPAFEIWEGEVKRFGYTYSVDTLRELHSIFPENTEFYYILGTDALKLLPTWKNADEVFTLCKFIGARRPGNSDGEFEAAKDKAKAAGATVFESKSMKFIEASSTEVRKTIDDFEKLKLFVPEKVAEYIIDKKLYKFDETMTEEQIILDLKETLKPDRFTHSLGVSKEAVRLAEKFGADSDKCRLAGLVHDCAKYVSRQQLEWMGVDVSAYEKASGGEMNPRVIHGFGGRILAERKYGITDSEVLAAVEHHVTGVPDMGLIEQIIFIADYTEEGRMSEGEGFQKLREVLERDGLKAAIVESCDGTIKRVIERGESLDLRTVATRNWAIKSMHNAL